MNRVDLVCTQQAIIWSEGVISNRNAFGNTQKLANLSLSPLYQSQETHVLGLCRPSFESSSTWGVPNYCSRRFSKNKCVQASWKVYHGDINTKLEKKKGEKTFTTLNFFLLPQSRVNISPWMARKAMLNKSLGPFLWTWILRLPPEAAKSTSTRLRL